MTAMVRAGGLRGYRELVRSLGGDPARLLRRHHVDAALLAREDALLPLRALVHLLEGTAAALHCPDFGLRLSRTQDISVLGPLAVAMQNATTVAEAMTLGARYLFVQSPGIAFSVFRRSPDHPQWAELRYEILLPQLPATRQAIDLSIGLAHRVIQVLARERYRLHEVHLPHAPVAPLSVYQRHFGAPVRTARNHASLLLARSTLDAPMQSVNATLRQMAVSYLDVQFPAPGQSVGARVRQAVSRSLGTGHARKDSIAGLLAMHPRTLQRRLGAEGTSFEAIYDAVCRDTVLRNLGGTQMPIGQIADLIGLSRPAALTRACRRWFGATPLQVRRDAQDGRPASKAAS
jgi:AraC-like DNA-binding protein